MRALVLPLLLVSIAAALPLAPQEVEFETTVVRDGVACLFGQGGNIGVVYGDQGALMIDSQFAPLTEDILEQVAALTDHAPRFLVNTHWHGDHTGGNENLGRGGAVIVAHENVRARLQRGASPPEARREIPPAPPVALPVVTHAAGMRLHWGGQTVELVHLPRAHTDGDTLVRMIEADVMHAGDTFFNGNYPYIDVGSGGTLDGIIAAAETTLSLCGDETRIIPGHGDVARPEDLRRYHAMLVQVRAAVLAAMEGDASLEQVLAAAPTAPWDAEWGNGFMTPARFTEAAYASLRAR